MECKYFILNCNFTQHGYTILFLFSTFPLLSKGLIQIIPTVSILVLIIILSFHIEGIEVANALLADLNRIFIGLRVTLHW